MRLSFDGLLLVGRSTLPFNQSPGGQEAATFLALCLTTHFCRTLAADLACYGIQYGMPTSFCSWWLQWAGRLETIKRFSLDVAYCVEVLLGF